jgi:hypothetical protein
MQVGPEATKNAFSDEGMGVIAVTGRSPDCLETIAVLVLPRHIKFLIFEDFALVGHPF